TMSTEASSAIAKNSPTPRTGLVATLISAISAHLPLSNLCDFTTDRLLETGGRLRLASSSIVERSAENLPKGSWAYL
ncbi:MAG: hypothetical protein M3Y83_04440, partial [Actinomycetota bacterium]|nr:hypothetical protein [Actinomycetota bacterium]